MWMSKMCQLVALNFYVILYAICINEHSSAGQLFCSKSGGRKTGLSTFSVQRCPHSKSHGRLCLLLLGVTLTNEALNKKISLALLVHAKHVEAINGLESLRFASTSTVIMNAQHMRIISLK